MRLTMLRTLKQLTKLPDNLDGFYNAGLVDLCPPSHPPQPATT